MSGEIKATGRDTPSNAIQGLILMPTIQVKSGTWHATGGTVQHLHAVAWRGTTSSRNRRHRWPEPAQTLAICEERELDCQPLCNWVEYPW